MEPLARNEHTHFASITMLAPDWLGVSGLGL